MARRYHLHASLVVYCLVALLMSIGAFNSNNNLLFWLFFLSLSLIVVSGFISGAMLMAVRVERLPVGDVQAGEAFAVRYRVSNAGRWAPLFAATITETPSRTSDPAASSDFPADAADGALASPPAAFAAHAGAGQTIEVETLVRAESRGVVRLSEFTLTSEFPFGIVRKSVRFRQPETIVVRPRPAETAHEIEARTSAGASHEDPSERRAGPSDHFFALREYHPGDSPRSIAWRASARLAGSEGVSAGATDLLVRQTTAPRPRRLVVLLDLASAASPEAYEHAVSRAAGAIREALRRGALVGLAIRRQSDASVRLAGEPRSGRWHASRLLNELALVPSFDPTVGRASASTPLPDRAVGGAEVVVIAADRAPPDTGGRGGPA